MAHQKQPPPRILLNSRDSGRSERISLEVLDMTLEYNLGR